MRAIDIATNKFDDVHASDGVRACKGIRVLAIDVMDCTTPMQTLAHRVTHDHGAPLQPGRPQPPDERCPLLTATLHRSQQVLVKWQ